MSMPHRSIESWSISWEHRLLRETEGGATATVEPFGDSPRKSRIRGKRRRGGGPGTPLHRVTAKRDVRTDARVSRSLNCAMDFWMGGHGFWPVIW